MIWRTVACREVDQPEFGIEGGRVPDRRPPTHRIIRAGRPGIAAELAGSRQGIVPPKDGAGLGVQGGEAPAYPILPTGNAAVDDPVVVEWRAGDRVAIFIVLKRGLPDHFARLHVQSHDGGVELPEKQQPLTHRQTAVGPATAEGALPS